LLKTGSLPAGKWGRSSLRSRRRPVIVTLLSLGVLILATLYLIRLAASLRSPSLPFTIPTWYLPLTGAVWGVGGLLLASGLFVGHGWAPTVARWGGLAFLGWYWADRLLLGRSDYSAVTRPAGAVLSLTAVMILLLGLNREGAREYFGENSS